MLEVFAGTYSEALQKTLYLMGKAALEARPEVAEVKFSALNKHHFVGRPAAVRRGEQQRGLHRRRPALRASSRPPSSARAAPTPVTPG